MLDAFSKSFAMTGWRLGYAVLPKEWTKFLSLLVTNSNSCTCTFTQIAGVEALLNGEESVRAMTQEFRQRREFMEKRMTQMEGIKIVKPQGAFYFFPNITYFGMTSKELADYLLKEGGVAVLPGTSFGHYGEGYLRISFANSLEKLNRAMDKMEEALSKLKRRGGK